MPSIADLFITVSSDVGGAITGLSAVDTKLNGTTTSMQTATAAALPLAAAAAGVGAAFLGAIDEAASFEQQISGIKAVMAPDEAILYGDALEDLALTLGRETVFSASAAASAIEELVKAGVPIESVFGDQGAARAVTSLAAATGFDLTRSAEFAGIAMNTFHMTAEEMTRTVDTLSGVVNASAADMNGLQFAFSAVGPVAASLGLTFDDTAIALGIFADNGLRGSDAGTSLKTMLLNLQPTTKEQTAAFRELGLYTIDTEKGMEILTARLSETSEGQKVLTKVQSDGIVSFEELFKAANTLNPALVEGAKDSNAFAREMGLTSNAFFDASGNAKPLNEIFGILKTSTEGLTNQQRLLLLEMAFGADAVRAASIAAEEGAEGFNLLAENVGKISAADAAKTRLDNLRGSLEQMGGSFEAVQIQIGTLFLPVIRQLVDWVTALFNAFLTLPEPIQVVLVAIVGISGAIAGLTAAFVLLSPMFAAVGAGFAIIAAAASPVLIPILAITAAVAALYLAWETNFGGIREVAAETWAALQPLFENIANLFGQIQTEATPVLQGLATALAPLGPVVEQAFGAFIRLIPDTIRLIGDFWNTISQLIGLISSGEWSGAWDVFVNVVWQLGSRVGEALGSLLGYIRDALANQLLQIVANLPDPWLEFVNAVWNLGTRVGEAIGNVLGFIGESLGSIAGIVEGVGDVWKPLIDGAWNIGARIAEAFGNFLGFIGESISGIPGIIEGQGDIWGAFITAAWNIGTRLAEAFGNFINFIGEQIGGIPQLIEGLGDLWAPFITAAWNIGTRIADAFGNFLTYIGDALGGIPAGIEGLGDFFGPFVTAAWNVGGRIADAINNAISYIGEAIGGIPTLIEGMGDIFGGIVAAAGDLYNRISAAIEPIKTLLSNTFGAFWDWLTGAIVVPTSGTGGTSGGTSGGFTGGTTTTSPAVYVGTLIISSEAEAQAFLDQVAQAVLASANRVSPPVSGATALT